MELLVAVGIFLFLYAGTHGLFTATWTAWRRNNERINLYQVGNGLVDSITRDIRSGKNLGYGLTPSTSVSSTEYMVISGSNVQMGNGLTLVINYAARRNAAGRYDQKRVTYFNTASGFKRRIETGETEAAGTALTSGATNYQSREWTLTQYVANFQFENWPLFASYPRLCRFFLYLDPQGAAAWPSYKYRINGRAVTRMNRDVQDSVSY